ncbi:hypothetical protein M885DRAFT_51864 [Pelagophyceae sp. CCMP2097]|nr:hypothetical protein M885DRAFT_51864 [Pelagophyceae sp. CCMP2097]
MREIYFRVLKAEYLGLVETGFIPYKSDAALILLTAVETATDHVEDRLCDFEFIRSCVDLNAKGGLSLAPCRNLPAFFDRQVRKLRARVPQRRRDRQALHATAADE